MKPIDALQACITQAEFAQMIGVSEAAVSHLKTTGVIESDASAHAWLLAYCNRLREQAAGRMDATGGTDLAYERALLARSQREGQEIKNAVARGKFAAIELLSDVLSNVVQAAVDRFDQIPAALRKTCPDLPRAALDTVLAKISSARNEIVTKADLSLADVLDDDEMPVEDDESTEEDEATPS